MTNPNSTNYKINNSMTTTTASSTPPTGENSTASKAKYPNPNLSRSRSILLKENSKSPPCITVGLRPQLEVLESSNPLELKVIYLGEPLPTISWKKDNVPLSDQENTMQIKSKPNCSILYLASVKAESDAGLYSCTVENSEGKVETRCQLSILSKSVSKSSLQSKQQKQTSSVPRTSLTNKQEVDDSPEVGSTGTGSSPQLQTGTGIQPSPPIILDHLKCVRAEDGAEVELSCKIVCPPCSFDVVWIHNGKEIKPSKDFQYHHVDNRYSIKIPELFPEDAGVYTCEAFNDYGETFTTCSLYVTCPGKQSNNSESATAFKTFPKSISVARGGPVVVQAELQTGSDRQVTWIKDGCVIDQTSVNDQNKVQFSIIEAGVRDAGIYELHANMTSNENVNGNDENVNGNENGENSVNVNESVNEARSKEQQTTTAIAAFAIIVL